MQLFVYLSSWSYPIVTARAATLEDSTKGRRRSRSLQLAQQRADRYLVDAFKKKYPNIKPSFYRGTSERVLQRAVTESKAGRFAVDVVTSAGFQIQLMKESGLTQRFVPPEASFLQRRLQRP
jgi:hypothetical protein